MKVKDISTRQGHSISFEFFPPKDKEGEDKLFQAIHTLEEFGPTFVSVTYGAGGGTLKNTRQVIERIKRETRLTPMPHLTCVEQSKEELTAILEDYLSLDIENILALRGDPPHGAATFSPKNGLCYAKDLVQLATSFDAFSIGVAVYPEGHIEAPNLDTDLLHTKEKIEAGADFAITQMFFDNRFFYNFLEKARRIGIRVPIIPGIMPVTDIERIKRFCDKCGTTLPAKFVRDMENATSSEEARKVGIDFTTKQCEDLLNHGIRYFHFYTMNSAEAVAEILSNLNLKQRLEPVRADSAK